VDQDWLAHQEFFKNIGQHLAPNGVILLQENQAGSLNREKDFAAYIESAGLEITDVFDSPSHYTPDHYTQIYYIEIRQK
jgi:spermidine synthase